MRQSGENIVSGDALGEEGVCALPSGTPGRAAIGNHPGTAGRAIALVADPADTILWVEIGPV